MSAPDAAVQIAEDALNAAPADAYESDRAWCAVAALDRAEWLHDPAEVAALRAVADAVRGQDRGLTLAVTSALAALDALPPTDQP